jgi:phospholipid-binding lipoprotein MlaA
VKSSLSRPAVITIVVITIVLCCAGCTSTPSSPRDPLEPMNRVIYRFNDQADQYVMKPVAQDYHDYLPQFMRSGVRNFFNNLDDASSSVNDALQGKPKASLYNFSRFVLNTTVGIAGLIDVTSGHDRVYPQTGFGDTFAIWGWKNSSYLVIPILGPSTLRDGTGTISGMAFQNDVLYNHPSVDASASSTIILGIDTREKLLGVQDAINGAALDPYAYTRDAWLQIRAKQTGDALPQQKEDDLNIDDLMN